MKINAVISKPAIEVNSANKSAILSAVIISMGIMSGVGIYLLSNGIIDELCDCFFAFVTDFSNKNKPEILSGLILSNVPYLIMMLIFATSVIGVFGIVGLTFAKSMGMGLLITYIYDSFALKGIVYSLLVILPGKFVMILAMILLTQSSIITSQDIRKSISCRDDKTVSLHKFALRIVVILLIFILSSIIDFITICSFSSLFEFI